MSQSQSEYIEVHQLQVGMFIELELGWMAHPFPMGSFKISSDKQIAIIQKLGLKRVRFIQGKSDPVYVSAGKVELGSETLIPEEVDVLTGSAASAGSQFSKNKNDDPLALQQRNMAVCERKFADAIRQYKTVVDQVNSRPDVATSQCLDLVNALVDEMLGTGESVIRLLSEGIGDKAAMHPVNVTVISLLLGKSMGLTHPDMVDLGVAAFLHDIGKSQLPARVRWLEDNFSSVEYKLYQEHVEQSILLAKRMELSPGVLNAIAQHHEMVDGSGFPGRLKGDQISMPVKILALINRYDNLCNPGRLSAAVTPHEALSLIFAQLKPRFDSVTLSAFIRMMGVYPPGSVVQLVDERFALVVSVNSTRPLKPRVVVYDPAVSKYEALILDLETTPHLGIRRCL
jgi:putative nucleotidyltransferase with HDIG domain